MGRNTQRASGLKALQAIKGIQNGKTKQSNVQQSENIVPNGKRASSPGSLAPPNPKRSALGDVTNATGRQGRGKPAKTAAAAKGKQVISVSDPVVQSQESSQTSEDTPITTMNNVLQATKITDDSLRADESLSEDMQIAPSVSTSEPQWKDIDKADAHDPLSSSEYAIDIFSYMRAREDRFVVHQYLDHQPDITASMRTILVDWLIEVQENFELFHETLYLAVKLVDLFLQKKEVKREYLQLVGATSMLIASKFEELSPPLVDDFLYLCDDAYTREELIKTETEILQLLGYDINIPVAYRFLRRFARAADASLETHTLARYIAESTLQEYQFVGVKPSLIAASAMYLALRMNKLGGWTPTLYHYSGYTVADMLPCAKSLNALLKAALGNTATVRSKYSHEVFFKVALIAPLEDIDEDAKQVMECCPLSRT
ncbi:hypothetical protein EMCRGX_G025223 [Ephydatia muelleri]|eukprot:Em0021g62a